jgi:acyl-CoA thioester hydrolase
MRPQPFSTEPWGDQDHFVRNSETGLLWHRVAHRPLYADTDRSQVVYHANYLRYFELGRATLMRDVAYPYRAVEDAGFVYPIIDLQMRFHKPLYYDDLMWVHTRPIGLERIKVRFEYVITYGETGELVCTGYTYHCAINKSGVPVAVDEMTVAMWNEFPRAE